jgi:LacI family gluconate utilization system Gnt-I transcriptional repressor
MNQQVPTLADVAQHAGVSEITVSRVVRNKGPIAEATRDRVMKSIELLGYVPNRAAGSLASSGSMLLGVLLPSLSNIVFPDVLRGIHAALAATPYQALTGVTDYDPFTEERLVSSLMSWKPAAIIMAGFDHTRSTNKMLASSRVRVAEIMDIDAQPIDIAVGLSHRKAGFDTGRHLIAKGYRKFGYVGHDWDTDRRARLRFEGLRAALQEAGLSLIAQKRFEGPSSAAAGKETFEKLFNEHSDVDVVVFSNDDMAVGGYFHCMSAGIAIKDQVGLFGFNGLDIGLALPMPLSTIRSNRYLIGKTAAEKLLEDVKRPVDKTIIDTGYDIIDGATA